MSELAETISSNDPLELPEIITEEWLHKAVQSGQVVVKKDDVQAGRVIFVKKFPQDPKLETAHLRDEYGGNDFYSINQIKKVYNKN